MVRFRHFDYSVSETEAKKFVARYDCVSDFLNQYAANKVTYLEKQIGLARFFCWLHTVKKIDLTPSQFLNMHLGKRKANNVEDRRWALKLALEYSRDNPDLAEKAMSYKYSAFFLPIKMFCDYHEAPLTTSKGLFKKRGRRKYKDTLLTVEFVKRALAALPQSSRAVALVQLQAGQAIKQVLVDINVQAKRIFREIDAGKERIRFDFEERKGNGFAYFSYISRDAIQEIQKWRPMRKRILETLSVESDYLFVTPRGNPLTCKDFHTNARRSYIAAGIYSGPLSVRSHGFRKFFEQEASPPDRGISRSYVSFMMGHSTGDGQDHPLDAVGGTYDAAPRVYPSVVEKEYAKLEPYINIYSGQSHGFCLAGMPQKQQEALTVFAQLLNSSPEKMRKFQEFLLRL